MPCARLGTEAVKTTLPHRPTLVKFILLGILRMGATLDRIGNFTPDATCEFGNSRSLGTYEDLGICAGAGTRRQAENT